MAILSKGQTFADNDSVTSAKLNNLVDNAAFVSGSSGATDDASLEVNGSGRLQIKDSGVTNAKLGGNAVTASKIANDAVTETKIANNSVTTAKILDGSLTEAKLADDSVSTVKILDASVLTAKVADAAITAPKLSGAQTGTAPVYGVRAWVVFDATRDSTGASNTANTARFLIGSGNVTSVTKTATGEFTVDFTTALPNANYAYFGNSVDQGSSTEISVYRPIAGTKSTTQFQLFTIRRDGSKRDAQEATISFLG